MNTIILSGMEEKMKDVFDLIKGAGILAFKLYFVLPALLIISVVFVFYISSLTLSDLLSAKTIYWVIVAIIGVLSVKSQKFFIAFLIGITLFLLFCGIEYIHNLIY